MSKSDLRPVCRTAQTKTLRYSVLIQQSAFVVRGKNITSLRQVIMFKPYGLNRSNYGAIFWRSYSDYFKYVLLKHNGWEVFVKTSSSLLMQAPTVCKVRRLINTFFLSFAFFKSNFYKLFLFDNGPVCLCLHQWVNKWVKKGETVRFALIFTSLLVLMFQHLCCHAIHFSELTCRYLQRVKISPFYCTVLHLKKRDTAG